MSTPISHIRTPRTRARKTHPLRPRDAQDEAGPVERGGDPKTVHALRVVHAHDGALRAVLEAGRAGYDGADVGEGEGEHEAGEGGELHVSERRERKLRVSTAGGGVRRVRGESRTWCGWWCGCWKTGQVCCRVSDSGALFTTPKEVCSFKNRQGGSRCRGALGAHNGADVLATPSECFK